MKTLLLLLLMSIAQLTYCQEKTTGSDNITKALDTLETQSRKITEAITKVKEQYKKSIEEESKPGSTDLGKLQFVLQGLIPAHNMLLDSVRVEIYRNAIKAMTVYIDGERELYFPLNISPLDSLKGSKVELVIPYDKEDRKVLVNDILSFSLLTAKTSVAKDTTVVLTTKKSNAIIQSR